MWVGLEVIIGSKTSLRRTSHVSSHVESGGGRTGRSQRLLGLWKERRDRKSREWDKYDQILSIQSSSL